MKRPYITCYMLNSLDGKIIGKYFETERGLEYIARYWQIHDQINARAYMSGRVTFQDYDWLLEENNTLVLPEVKEPVPRTDYVADASAEKYCIALDSSGKLAWKTNRNEGAEDYNHNRGRSTSHVITVLTEKVSDAYLQYLRDRRVSYIFSGKEKPDFHVVMEKLYALFGIDHLLVEGGSLLNGSLIREGLIDEYCVLLMATVDGGTGEAPSKTSFEAGREMKTMIPVDFTVKEIRQIDDTGVLMSFVRKEKELS